MQHIDMVKFTSMTAMYTVHVVNNHSPSSKYSTKVIKNSVQLLLQLRQNSRRLGIQLKYITPSVLSSVNTSHRTSFNIFSTVFPLSTEHSVSTGINGVRDEMPTIVECYETKPNQYGPIILMTMWCVICASTQL